MEGGPKEREGEGEGEESGGDIAEMRWRMKGGKGRREGRGKGMDDRPTKEGSSKEGERTNGGDGKFSTHTLPKRYCCGGGQTDETAAMAANGMAFISRQFADPSLHFASLCKNSASAADKFVAGERRRERIKRGGVKCST